MKVGTHSFANCAHASVAVLHSRSAVLWRHLPESTGGAALQRYNLGPNFPDMKVELSCVLRLKLDSRLRGKRTVRDELFRVFWSVRF